MKRCGQTHGRDLQYTGTAQHNSRIHQVRCFYDEKDGTRPAPEVGEEQEGEGRIMDAFNKSIAYISSFNVSDGSIRVWCTKWDKKNKYTKNWVDSLNVSAETKELLDWIGK